MTQLILLLPIALLGMKILEKGRRDVKGDKKLINEITKQAIAIIRL